MAGKKRKVYLYEPYLEPEKGDPIEVPESVWKELLDETANLTAEERRRVVGGHAYSGRTRTTSAPLARYLYIGRTRDQSDWPDHALPGIEENPLDVEGDLVEPMYLLPMAGTRYVAVMRNSAGPRVSSAAEWISKIIEPKNAVFRLRPVVRMDALDRLMAAEQVGAVDLRIDEHTDIPENAGQFTDALRELQSTTGANATISVRVTYGHAGADSVTTSRTVSGLERLLGSTGVHKAQARVNELKSDGKLHPAQLDFFSDQIAQQVSVGRSTQEPQKPEVVMAAMLEAIEKFRSNLDTIRKGGVIDDVEDDPDEVEDDGVALDAG